MLGLLLTACFLVSPTNSESVDVTVVQAVKPVLLGAPAGTSAAGGTTNTCPSYAPSWVAGCPVGSRCITFTNSCTGSVALNYQVGCNSDGTPGAPQCNCTTGPVLAPGGSESFVIVDGDYAVGASTWTPACLTEGLAVLVNNGATGSCTTGSRVEFTAGNSGNIYGKADFFNLDVEKGWFSVPLTFDPDLSCAHDNANHDCRPLVCDSATCPDAYATPTTGGCADGRSPQAACQDTFGNFGTPSGFTVNLCPSPVPPSCQNATACP